MRESLKIARAVSIVTFFGVGIFGRFPWKADEPYSFGIVWGMLRNGQWLIPHIAGEPFVEKPPLVYWLGAIGAWPFGFIPAHEASRLAVVALAGMTVWALWKSASALRPEAMRWQQQAASRQAPHSSAGAPDHVSRRDYAMLAVLVFAGTVGVAEHIHKLTADLGQLAGCAIALYGLVRLYSVPHPAAPEHRVDTAAGAWVGTGIGVAFMSKGLLVPGLVVLTWLGCWLLPASRQPGMRKAALVAVVFALPWLLVWPSLFRAASPVLFDEWLWANNIGRFLGEGNLGGTGVPLLNKLASIVWVAFPALPLAVVTVVRTGRFAASSRAEWEVRRHAPGHVCVALFCFISLAVLLASGSFRDNYLLPLIVGLVLLGLPAAQPVDGPVNRFLERSVDIAFAAAAVAIVLVWIQLVAGGTLWPASFGQAVGRALPLPFLLPISWPAVSTAVLVLSLRIFIARRSRPGSVVESWCGGFTMLWSLCFSLLLPWVDAARSYETTFMELRRQVGVANCIATFHLGESEVSMLQYVAGTETPPLRLGDAENPAAAQCDWLVELSKVDESAAAPDFSGWRFVWRGHRPADARERFNLYRKVR